MIDNKLKNAVKEAYNDFTSKASQEEKERVDGFLKTVHSQASDIINGVSGAVIDGHEFAHVWSTINDEVESLFDIHKKAKKTFEITKVRPDGNIVGFGKYEMLDPGWLWAAVQFLLNIFCETPFDTSPLQKSDLSDSVSLAISGDWGTGFWETNSAAESVQQQMNKCNPDYTIHLGDVYYAGTVSEETKNFINIWPNNQGNGTALALNSNHEMYSAGKGYFKTALTNDLFKTQNETSYFSLENSNWIIVGLDSARYSSKWTAYLTGRINKKSPQVQTSFLQNIAKNAKGRKIIVLSHHQGLDLKGKPKEPLWSQVTKPFNGNGPDYWYWGHIHAGAVYKKYEGVYGRCNGHGAIPWGLASDLQDNDKVAWFVDKSAGDKRVPERVMNGFVYLELNGKNLTEKFIDEAGKVGWKKEHS